MTSRHRSHGIFDAHVVLVQPPLGLASSYPPSLSAESLPVLSHPPSGDFGCPGPPIYFTDLEVRDIRKVSTACKLTDAVNEPAIRLHLSRSKRRFD